MTVVYKIFLSFFTFQIKKTYWPSDWSGHEYSIKFHLVTPLYPQCFNELIGHFFDPDRTVTLWKNGFIKRDGGCDILVTNNLADTTLQLTTRILHYKKQLNLKANTTHTHFAKFIYMQYYLFIKSMLNRHSITYITNAQDLSKHLRGCCETTDDNEDTDEENLGDLNNLVATGDRQYFDIYFLHEHQFSRQNLACQCAMSMGTYNSLINSFKQLYPDKFNVSTRETDTVHSERLNRIKLKRIDSFYDSYYGNTSFESAFAMHPCKFPEFKLRLIDFNYKDKCKFNIVLVIRGADAALQQLRLIIDLSRNLYYMENFEEPLSVVSNLVTDFKYVENRAQLEDAQANSSSAMHSMFTSGDAIRVKYRWLDEENSKVIVFINMRRVVKFKIASGLVIYPCVDMQVKSEKEKQPAVYLSSVHRITNRINLDEFRSSSRGLEYLKGSKVEAAVRAGLEKADEAVATVEVSCQEESRIYRNPHSKFYVV